MTTYGRIIAIAVLTLLAGTARADEPAALQSEHEQYVIMTRLLFAQPNASAPAQIGNANIKALGGTMLAGGSDRIIAHLPPQAVDALRHHPGVRYLQRAVPGPQPTRTPAASGTGLPGLRQETTGLRTEVQWNSGTYAYDGAGNITQIGTDTFTYDGLSRLEAASVAGNTESYTYDAFGNMTNRKTNNADYPSAVNAQTNRLSGVTYDEAGNVTAYGTATYTWDPFSMMREQTTNGATDVYIYTASDERIGVLDGDRWIWSLRDEEGRVLRQFDSLASAPNLPWRWVEDYVYRDGLLLGAERYPEEGGRRHFHLDHLGTPRRVTGAGGANVSRHDYYPFGNEITSIMQGSGAGFDREEPMRFTSHERDFVGGTTAENTNYLDYMRARHANPSLGRFLSVDPIISKESMRSPQLWNRYSYVGNNPLGYVDPDGRLLQLSGCVKDQSSDACKGQFNLYLSTFGKQSGDGAKYLSVGKNGIVGFNGISGSAFAARFGAMGRATNYLVSNRAATFSLVTGRSEKTIEGRGAYFDPRVGGGGTIGIDPSAFPQAFFGVPDASITEGLVHEMGHAVSSLMPGYASGVDAMAAASRLMRMGSGGRMEAYATDFENAWRRDVLGAANLRNGYFYPYDVRDIGSTPLFP